MATGSAGIRVRVSEHLFLKFDSKIDESKVFLRTGVTRDELSELMGVDKTVFSLIIREYSGCKNMNEYLNVKRLAYLPHVIADHPNYTLEAIARDCGIGRSSTFNRIFKQHYGITPSEFRQRLLSSGNIKTNNYGDDLNN
ncbi:MAG: AraC family transcriptional regulator [Bacteroidales bacterium]|nr:AraC family transcriptional regulator [Bacteroidales bacterium]